MNKFNLERALAGEKLITLSGDKPHRFLYYPPTTECLTDNITGDSNYVALFKTIGCEDYWILYNSRGRRYLDNEIRDHDLYMEEDEESPVIPRST
jgi:hypothetical protein